jgi:CubicO group peptidase (beta-lactamase class C family)
VLAAHLSTWPAPAAAGVAWGQGETATAGWADRPFAWASVTKVLVGLSCLVAAEEGSVRLDEPAGPPGSTLAHLLAHASGLPFEGADPVSPPGRRRIYSNSGIELAAAHLASRTGVSFEDYLTEAVLQPLGMTATACPGSPAHSAAGPLVDLLALAGELRSPTLVSPETLHEATTAWFPGLGGVVPGFGRYDPCDWGLAMEVKGPKSPHWTGRSNAPSSFGHFGQSGSFVWVDPEAGVALAALSGSPFGAWSKQAWPALSDAVLGHPAPG